MLALNAPQGDLQDDLGPHIENPGNPEGIRASEETAESNCAHDLAPSGEELTSCRWRV